MNFLNWKKVKTEEKTFFIQFLTNGTSCSLLITNFLEVFECNLNKKQIEDGISVNFFKN